MATDLFTLAEYKAYAGLNSPNQDTAISALIPVVSSAAKTYCERTFVDGVDDAIIQKFNGGVSKLYLKEYPLVSLSSLEYSTDYGQNYTALVEFVDFVYDDEEQCLVPLTSTEFPKAVNGYKVTYTAGYEDGIPEDLKVACMDLLTYYLKNDFSVKSQRDAGSNTVQIEYITKNTLPSHIQRVFDLYRSNWS